MGEAAILVEGPMGAAQVDVVWRVDDCRASGEAAAYIESRWNEYLAAATASGGSLFNGPVTRLIGARREGEKIVLTLGATDYKSFVVTVLRDRAWFEAHAPDAMTPALGNSVLLTRGDRALLGIRSARTSAYGGRAHLIGGVLDLLGAEERSREGIIAHLRREMEEEAAIDERELEREPVLMAVARDEFLAQPELIWRWEVRVDLELIGKRLRTSEHDGWVVLERGDLSTKLRERMTPVARTAWERWR